MPDLICYMPNHGLSDDTEIFVSWFDGNYFVYDSDKATFNASFKLAVSVGGAIVQFSDTITEGYIRIETGVATSTISGLDHLNGKTISITSGGNLVGTFVVVNGEVEVPSPITTFQAGLTYTCKIRTTRLSAPQEPGAIQARQKKINRAALRHSKTKGAKLGQEYPIRTNANELVMTEFTEDLNAVFDTDSRDISVSIPGGISTDGYVIIKSVEPSPMTVIAAVIDYTVEETR
jgi:hypothetical protein